VVVVPPKTPVAACDTKTKLPPVVQAASKVSRTLSLHNKTWEGWDLGLVVAEDDPLRGPFITLCGGFRDDLIQTFA